MKGSGPEETLRKGSQPKGNDMSAPGNSQGTDGSESGSMSNTETLRMGSKPKSESVRQASMNQGCLTSARAAYLKSNGGSK